eukprot:CAMPEP_0202978888 /NCGR_PEP_ID=MMETSP1396-20130829/85186_1 /ASSEMBLY_ACC=CAM_ASM_000872 /TAXON_ID= /ORGANISM="Pseudokeronopsis sp., Strain Brazil" /LENGTH=156 /DNA_ID=CAMNT_0049718061 /DNA_START=601 /DNA_END=1068 /DNA_ORIENTATION=+
MKFEAVFARGDVPSHRDEHTAVIYENSMVIFGGFEYSGERVNEIFRYFFSENKWEKVMVMGGELPSPRAGHSAVMIGDSMLIFAGKDNGDQRLNDLWEFSFNTYEWTYLACEEPPLQRSGHSAAVYRDYMVVFGGIYEVTKELNDLHLFDTRTKKW